MPTPRN